MTPTAEELLDNLDADHRSGDLDTLLSEAFIQLIKEQAIEEFLAENNITCPHCNHDLTSLPRQQQKTVSHSPDTNSDEIEPEELEEAKELLQEINSWSEEEFTQLPPRMQEKARQYQKMCRRDGHLKEI